MRRIPRRSTRLLDENEVASVEDLRALEVEGLGELQKWLDKSETDPLDAFYSGAKRVDENTARNRIVDRLQGRMTALGLSVAIERHMAGGNGCDITASATIEGANRLLVTEVKGQWNKELHTAASAHWASATRSTLTQPCKESTSRFGTAMARRLRAIPIRRSQQQLN